MAAFAVALKKHIEKQPIYRIVLKVRGKIITRDCDSESQYRRWQDAYKRHVGSTIQSMTTEIIYP